MILDDNSDIKRKLEILADSAKYDVACTSSGMDRKGTPGEIGNSQSMGICHTFSADGRCISLLKVLFTNECIFDCKYCINRSSNDVPRASFEPDELCKLTIEFYRRNYIEGLFLSSGILHNPNYTMERMVETLRKLREEYHFNGYIHCKSIPGADPYLVEMCGWYADRMSVNLELPTNEGLRALAPNKSRKAILTPLRQIQEGIDESRNTLGYMGGNIGAYKATVQRLKASGRFKVTSEADLQRQAAIEECSDETEVDVKMTKKENLMQIPSGQQPPKQPPRISSGNKLTMINRFSGVRGFAPAGQSTQMIIGATPESDYHIISVAEALYQRFDLKRVFYSAFIRVNEDSALPVLPGGPPLLREHRLYQADWLLRYYGFQSAELLSEKRQNFNTLIDPKCDWAIQHLEEFPVEVNRADYFTLLRVPGIGPKSARRIVAARRMAALDFKDLKKIGVVLKRALYFITCKGRMMYPTKLEENYITNQLVGLDDSIPKEIKETGLSYKQLSLFDTAAPGFFPENLKNIG